jgi:hypothetical protein
MAAMHLLPNPVVVVATGAAIVVSALAYLVKRSDYDEIREEGFSVSAPPAGS